MAPIDRRDQERARRKQEILRAARAVFADSGFERATVEAVAHRAEIGKGTIYLYFENKETILAELVLQALNALVLRLQTAADQCSLLHPDQRLHALADAYLAFAQNMPDYFRLLNAYDHGSFGAGISAGLRQQIVAESNRTLELVTQAIADGMALGLFAPGDARQLAGVIWAALTGVQALLAYPVRREWVAVDALGLYRATLTLCLKGLTCPTPGERSVP